MAIRALVFQNGEMKLKEVEPPLPDKGEVLINVELAGICNTDLEILSGMIDFTGIPGHEFVGRVVEDSGGSLEDEIVVGEINIPCHECERCLRCDYIHCQNIKTLGMRGHDGVFAEYAVLPRENVHPVPSGVGKREAVFVEPIAAAVEIVEQYHIKPSEEIVVLGDGKLGQVTARALNALGYEVAMVGRHQSKLAALSCPGISTYLEKDFSRDSDVPVVVEATGSSGGLEAAIDIVAPRGKIIFKTTTSEEYKINLASLAIDEVKILGSRCGPFEPALKLLKQNDLRLEEIITAEYPLDEAEEAFEIVREKDSLKVLLKP